MEKPINIVAGNNFYTGSRPSTETAATISRAVWSS
ncbi:hypothetical protein [Nitrosospira sp. Is2]